MKSFLYKSLIFLAVCIIVIQTYERPTAAHTSIPIRVGYINGYGITEESGALTGYAYEYLNEISKYTNFSYEFISGDWNSNLERIESGKIDLICPMITSEYLNDLMNFPDKSIGCEYLGLYTSLSNDDIYFNDFDSFNGMKVGSFGEIEAFEAFKAENGFSAEYVFFNDVDKMYDAAINGEIDAYILESSAQFNNVKMIAKLDVNEYYIATKKDDGTLVKIINDAQRQILKNDFSYTSKLYNKYYGNDVIGTPAFTKAEKEYIDLKEEISIAYEPLSIDKDGQKSGILAELINLISLKGGLNIKLVECNDYAESASLLKNNEVSALIGYIYDTESYDNRITDTITSIPLCFVGNKNFVISNGSKIVISEKFNDYFPLIKAHYPGLNLLFGENLSSQLNHITNKKADAGLINSYSLNTILTSEYLTELTFLSSSDISVNMQLIMSENANPLLLPVLDKSIKRISAEEMNSIILKDTMVSEINITFSQFFKQNIYMVTTGALIIFAIFFGYILFVNQRVKKKLYNMAYFDSMTNAPNIEKARLDINEIFLKNEQNGYSLLFFDIKNFKYLNDILGYKTGSDILTNVSKLCQESIGPLEYYARVSSDVFLLFVQRSKDEINDITEFFRKSLNSMPQVSSYALNIVIEWGVYEVSDDEPDFERCLDKANYARKLIKGDSVSNICFYDETLKKREQTIKQIESGMHRAMSNGEFTVFFQPKVEIGSGRIIAAEALVRWMHGGEVLWFPNDFISVFEKNGFISELDMYMLSSVCQYQKKWLDMGLNAVPVSVNQSKILISKTNYVNEVISAVKKHEIPSNLIEIEITETILHDNIELLTDIITRLHNEGFSFSIDDFGSGYSSLQLLSNIKADTLKIDRGILLKAVNNPGGMSVLKSIVILASEIGMTCICEGVETKEHEKMLLGLGCQYAQGYLYGKPMTASDFEMLLKA